MQKKDLRKRAVVALLHNVRNRHAPIPHPASGGLGRCGIAARARIRRGLVGSSAVARPAARVLEISQGDIQRESYQAIAATCLSRSHSIALNDAREHFAQALRPPRRTGRAGKRRHHHRDDDARFVASTLSRRRPLRAGLPSWLTVAETAHDAVQGLERFAFGLSCRANPDCLRRRRTHEVSPLPRGQVVDERMKTSSVQLRSIGSSFPLSG